MSRLEDQALYRMYLLLEMVLSGATEMTGRARREYEGGKVVGRFGGGMTKMFPELDRLGMSPSTAAAAISKGRGKTFERIRSEFERQLIARGEARESIRREPKKTVRPHKAKTAKCKRCGQMHSKAAHRSHGKGAFHRTHLFSFGDSVKKENFGRGKAFTFHGSYTSKLMARKKERQIPGSFIEERNGRYYVLKPKRIRNPKKLVVIYGRVLRIEAQKVGPHHCDAECKRCNHCYVHDFRTKPTMYGQADGSLLIKGR